MTGMKEEGEGCLRSYDDVLRHVAHPSKAPTRLSYLICATPRSGSTLLCECLSLTGVAGVPDEWLLSKNESLARASFGTTTTFDESRYLEEIIARSRTPNGVFGAKLMWPEMDQMRRGTRWNFALSGAAVRHSATLPNLRYIRMLRRDRIRQAISFFLAIRTNYWHKMRRDEHLPPRWPVEALRSDLADATTRSAILDEISACLADIERQEREWDRFFAEERITPFDVVYERLASDRLGVTLGILNFLALAVPENLALPHTWHMSMSDERNDILLAAYNKHISAA